MIKDRQLKYSFVYSRSMPTHIRYEKCANGVMKVLRFKWKTDLKRVTICSEGTADLTRYIEKWTCLLRSKTSGGLDEPSLVLHGLNVTDECRDVIREWCRVIISWKDVKVLFWNRGSGNMNGQMYGWRCELYPSSSVLLTWSEKGTLSYSPNKQPVFSVAAPKNQNYSLNTSWVRGFVNLYQSNPI